MAASLDDLYEQDFYAWTRDQARALRRLAETRPNVAIDLTHLIEEVEGLGKSERDAARSYLRTIIEHCLKVARRRAARRLDEHDRPCPLGAGGLGPVFKAT